MTKYKVNNAYGIFFMLLNTFSLALLYAVSKQVTQTMPSTQVVFFYKIIVFIMAMPWMFRIGISVFQTPQLKLHIIRGFLSICGSMFFVYGLKHAGLTSSTALGYLEQVLWVIIGEESHSNTTNFCVLLPSEDFFTNTLSQKGWTYKKESDFSPVQLVFQKGKFSVVIVYEALSFTSEHKYSVSCSIGIRKVIEK